LFHADRRTDERKDRQTDRRTDTTKLIVAFRSYAKAPEIFADNIINNNYNLYLPTVNGNTLSPSVVPTLVEKNIFEFNLKKIFEFIVQILELILPNNSLC